VLTDLIGEPSTRSETFRARWARHDVRQHLIGTKRLRHPGLTLLLYTGEPGTGQQGHRPGRDHATAGAPLVPARVCGSGPISRGPLTSRSDMPEMGRWSLLVARRRGQAVLRPGSRDRAGPLV